MVSSELVVLLIVCVGINTGSTQEICQIEDNMNCNYIESFDSNSDCVSTTLFCTSSTSCTAAINGPQRTCRFTGARNSQNINCCLCKSSDTGQFTGQLIWNCNLMNTTSSSTVPPTTTTLSTSTVLAQTVIVTPTATTVIDDTTINALVPIVAAVVVLVVCLLVVCVIATIIILYYRTKHHQQQTTKVVHRVNNTTNSELSLSVNNDRLYSQATTPQPNIYSTLTEPPSEYTEEEEFPDYSAIGDTTTTTKEEIPAGYSVITKTPDTSNDGLVYSAVVRQDGIKTTVKTTAQIDEQQQQSVSDTSNEGLVYSAVVIKDGIKTTVKTTVFKD